MEDKTFDLLSKMYGELTEFKMETGKRFDGLENRLTKIETGIENEIKPSINATIEGYQMVYDKLQEHDKRFDDLGLKIEKQDLEIRVIKAVK